MTAVPEPRVRAITEPLSAESAPEWSVADSDALYRVASWSDGFFHINDAGKVCVRINDEAPEMVIADIVAELHQRAIRLHFRPQGSVAGQELLFGVVHADLVI